MMYTSVAPYNESHVLTAEPEHNAADLSVLAGKILEKSAVEHHDASSNLVPMESLIRGSAHNKFIVIKL